ncbi:ABC transporter permease [Nocardioides soli]|uniref:ABC-2 type transport system permease protein n=1 Tax=Nocardioides soli TaxID=1036020 RepID=A0A7W4W063_9ACTN|nr:ABC transporter permease [Nocardioides soli]MBB3044979.1 ABC-2 type transport system permease protein [Nocardioides soli]
MTNTRIFFVGGLMSFRAQFNWLNPWILVPALLVSPVAQILLFAYVGRAAGVGDDQFFLVGNALNYAAIPCMFAMTFAISGERWGQTLGLVLVTPARRLPLFLGRALPVIVTGWCVAVFGLAVGSLLLGVRMGATVWPGLVLAVCVTSLSCTGLGLVMGAACLRVRDGATLGNVVFLLLLVFCGTNVALEDLPSWMAAVGERLPLTHGIEAARQLASGATLGSVSDLLVRELAIGLGYAALGLATLGWMERDSRRRATLERM